MIQDQNETKMNCNPGCVRKHNVRSDNLTAIQPKSHESRHSNVQGDNLKHESSRQSKISSIMRL